MLRLGDDAAHVVAMRYGRALSRRSVGVILVNHKE